MCKKKQESSSPTFVRKRIEELNIIGTNKDLKYISKLTNLKRLTISLYSGDLSFLQSLPFLEELNIIQ